MEHCYRSASECLKLLRSGEVSSLELVDSSIARIEALNPKLNAVVAKDYERARDKARAADAKRSSGEDLGALHGLPMTIKDSLETAGLVTTSGAPELRDHVPGENAVAVQRVVDAGAIILGKTNTPLYAGDWQTYNAVYGRTNNPWDMTRTVGGSSGGPAASIAAGFVPLEIGSDIAGSIRTPASYCGVYGHKPTHRIVPTRGHIPGPPGSKTEPDLGVVGPLGRTAEDLALALDVVAGPDALDRDGWSLNLPQPRAGTLKDFRVAYWLDDPLCPLDSSVRAELEATIEALRPHVKLIQIDHPFRLDEIVPIYIRLLLGVMSEAMPTPVKLLAQALSPYYALTERLGIEANLLTKNAVLGVQLDHVEWNHTNEARNLLRWQCRALFEKVDILLTPIVPVAAFPHQTEGNQLSRRIVVNGKKRPYLEHIPWIALATAAFLPATSAPVGTTPEGLPVNIQVVGPHSGDRTTIRFAELLADVRGGFRPPPCP